MGRSNNAFNMDDLTSLMQALSPTIYNKLIPHTTSTYQSENKYANDDDSTEKALNLGDLARLVQALPAELYNKIFELVCPFPDAGSQHIDRTYKPPSCLLISRVMRKMHTPNFYGNSIFYIKKAYFRSWVNSLTTDHIEYLKDVRIVDAFITPGLGGFPSADLAFAALAFPKWRKTAIH